MGSVLGGIRACRALYLALRVQFWPGGVCNKKFKDTQVFFDIGTQFQDLSGKTLSCFALVMKSDPSISLLAPGFNVHVADGVSIQRVGCHGSTLWLA